MKVLDVAPNSPLFGYIRPGYQIKSVNGHTVQDSIDFRYRVTDEEVKIIFEDPHGTELEFDFQDYLAEDYGLTLDDGKIKVCKNDCIFCYIRQQPQGMRRILYLKDEDYRLSFIHGNFITLSNIKDEDIDRIIEQRLSPLYVSVHATDDTLRRCMLRNEKLAPIIPRLKYLGENGITIHTQCVLCPGVNDGKYLEQTIDELASLYPNVETLGVVPVGLTKYRENLPNLRTYRVDEAQEIVKFVERKQRQLRKKIGTRFAWAADEFYIQAQLDFPKINDYEQMNQFENGLGMCRELITGFNRRKRYIKDIRSKKKVLFLTGYSACPFLTKEILPHLKNDLKLNVDILPVENKFWGEMVTVSGLLTGQDLLRMARTQVDKYDAVVLPPNCLNNDDLFLDNLSLEQFKRAFGKEVFVGRYNMADTVKEVFA